MEFTAVIEKLGRKVTMFHPDGTPARATLSVSFKEYRTLRQQLEDPRRESADKTKRRVVVGRDSAVAASPRASTTTPNEWVRIAEANDLDDPREIAPGDWLELPPMENPEWNWSTLSRDYGDFYAPAFAVRLGARRPDARPAGRREPGRGRPGARRGLALHASPSPIATATSCTRSRPAAARTCSSCSTFGAEVEICMGYGDAQVDADGDAAA